MTTVLDLVAEGRALLSREHEVLLSGDYELIDDLAVQKALFLDRLDAVLPRSSGDATARASLADLIRLARRNETLLQAAREGVVAARRRLKALRATRVGAVAYARDGSAISSRSDSYGDTKRA